MASPSCSCFTWAVLSLRDLLQPTLEQPSAISNIDDYYHTSRSVYILGTGIMLSETITVCGLSTKVFSFFIAGQANYERTVCNILICHQIVKGLKVYYYILLLASSSSSSLCTLLEMASIFLCLIS